MLDEPQAFKSKEVTKAGVLDTILQPDLYPDLYGDFTHKVSIHYYPPRGDDKEGWDNIDIFGWLHYPMQIKVNFLCKDSILAAPLALDLALFMDLASRLGWKGIQEWLSFYFKGPMVRGGPATWSTTCSSSSASSRTRCGPSRASSPSRTSGSTTTGTTCPCRIGRRTAAGGGGARGDHRRTHPR